MKGHMKRIFRFLGILDLFQQNVSLKLNNSYRVSITLGKLFTVGIFIFMLYNFFASDMIMRINPIVLQQVVQVEKRPKFDFNKENIVFSLAIVNKNNEIQNDPTIFDIYALQMFAENGRNAQQSFVETEKCTADYFERFPGYFESANLTFATCIKNNNFSISGYWDEDKVQQLNIIAMKCSNSSQSSLVCKSKEEIGKFFEEKFFSFWIEDKSFDMNKYENPVKSKIKYFSRTVEPSKTKIIRLFFRESNLILDNGYIYPSNNGISTFSLGDMEFDDGKSDSIVFGMILYSSDMKQVIQRRYQKLFDLLASLGGILNVLIISCSIFVKYFYEWELTERILNKLYVISHRYENFKQRKTNFIGMLKINSFHTSKIHSIKNNTNKNIPNDETFFQPGKIGMTFLDRISLFWKKKRNRSKKEMLYGDYISKCNKKLDMIELIRKLEEIEKIKHILFDEKQLSIFCRLNKQYLYLSDDQKENSKFKFTLAGTDEDESMQTYINKIKNDKNANWLAKRLINLLE